MPPPSVAVHHKALNTRSHPAGCISSSPLTKEHVTEREKETENLAELMNTIGN